MPTSSQALILKTTDGATQSIVGRPFWNPDSSWMNLYTKSEFNENSFLFSKHPRRKIPQRRSETASTAQTVRHDFSTLTELLKINGIHGSVMYDINSNSLRLQVPLYQHTSVKTLNNRLRFNTTADVRLRPTPIWSEIREKGGSHFETKVQDRLDDVEKLPYGKQHNVQNNRLTSRGNELVKLQSQEDGRIKIVRAPAHEADYFRLVQVSPDGVFCLIRTKAEDAGSFRLESTQPSDVGDFCLIPEDGFESDDFRLVTVNAESRLFRLLQADPTNGKWFRSITMPNRTDCEFRLVQAAISDINQPEFRGHLHDDRIKIAPPQTRNYEGNSVRQVEQQSMMKLQRKQNGSVELVKVPVHEADYFRLVQESPDGIFRLVSSQPDDIGSFRLEATVLSEVGDFRLIPEDGFESRDFRLITLDAENQLFCILEANSSDRNSFRSIALSNESDGQFHFTQTVSSKPFSQNCGLNKTTGIEPKLQESSKSDMLQLNNTKISVDMFRRSMHVPAARTSVQKKEEPVYFDNELSKLVNDGSRKSSFLPDITLYDSRHLSGVYREIDRADVENRSLESNELMFKESLPQGLPNFETRLKSKAGFKRMQKENMLPRSNMDKARHSNEEQVDQSASSWSSIDDDMNAFREKYIDSYREALPEVYEKLVSKGFRPANGTNEQRIPKFILDRKSRQNTTGAVKRNSNKIAGFDMSYQGSEWRTDDVEAGKQISGNNKTQEITSALTPSEITKLQSHQSRKTSLIDEVKLKANYKVWKKRKITAVRMRKKLPAKDPKAVCVSFRDNAIPHERLKEVVEKWAGSPVLSLQFDPVSIHSVDSDARSQWIIRFEDQSVCNRLVETGLCVNGELLAVRRYDDVMKEEYEAYQYYLILTQYKRLKQEKAMVEKKSKPNHRRKVINSHTQTAGTN